MNGVSTAIENQHGRVSSNREESDSEEQREYCKDSGDAEQLLVHAQQPIMKSSTQRVAFPNAGRPSNVHAHPWCNEEHVSGRILNAAYTMSSSRQCHSEPAPWSTLTGREQRSQRHLQNQKNGIEVRNKFQLFQCPREEAMMDIEEFGLYPGILTL